MSVNLSTNSAVTHINSSFGSANIDQKKVDRAINTVIQFLSQYHLSMVSEAFEKLKENPNHYEEKEFLNKELKIFQLGKMLVPLDSINNLGEQRYYASWLLKISALDKNDPFQEFLMTLSQRISELEKDFLANEVEIRLEKGFLHGRVNYWHYDDVFGKTATVCYSNKSEWSTRIIEKISCYEDGVKSSKEKLLEKRDELEFFSQPSYHGFFYHPQDIIHRSPIKEDLEEEIQVDDYRLFLRFRMISNKLIPPFILN